ncbi:MAG: acyl-CoA dehydrogenase [Pseudomonadota bacterium]
MFRDSVRGFAQAHLAEGALARAHAGAYPFDVARLFAAQGLLGITLPVSEGGQGGSLMDAVIAIQEVALVCPRSADVVQAGTFGPIRTFAEYGTPAQKERYLKPLLTGDIVIALGMSEPAAGSAVTDLATSARPDGDGFRLKGSKVFSTHSPHADVFLIYCRFGEGVGGIGSVLVERGQDGFDIGKPSRFMNGEDWAQLYFDDVRIEPENVLLPAGGFKRQIQGFNVERIGNASRSLAVGRHAFNLARAHVLEREQFGRPLAEFQGLQWSFVDMAMKLEQAQLMLYAAARSAASGGLPDPHRVAMAKLACNQAGFEVANAAMQAMGATGFSQDCLVEYCVRRARAWMIAGGSVEIIKNRIAEGVFGRRFSQRPEGPPTPRVALKP